MIKFVKIKHLKCFRRAAEVTTTYLLLTKLIRQLTETSAFYDSSSIVICLVTGSSIKDKVAPLSNFSCRGNPDRSRCLGRQIN